MPLSRVPCQNLLPFLMRNLQSRPLELSDISMRCAKAHKRKTKDVNYCCKRAIKLVESPTNTTSWALSPCSRQFPCRRVCNT